MCGCAYARGDRSGVRPMLGDPDGSAPCAFQPLRQVGKARDVELLLIRARSGPVTSSNKLRHPLRGPPPPLRLADPLKAEFRPLAPTLDLLPPNPKFTEHCICHSMTFFGTLSRSARQNGLAKQVDRPSVRLKCPFGCSANFGLAKSAMSYCYETSQSPWWRRCLVLAAQVWKMGWDLRHWNA